jgi:hypothetical protein
MMTEILRGGGIAMSNSEDRYAARLEVDYPEKLDRFTTFFRILWIIPIAIVFSILSTSSESTVTLVNDAGEVVESASWSSGSIAASLAVVTGLLIVFRQRYPRWWFNFALEFNRFAARIGAYLALLTDAYPSTEDEQAVHLELDYPEVKQDLNRWLPLVKWFLAIPHYFVLFFLYIGAFFAVVVAWFAILFTGRYPKGLFDYVVGVGRWTLRVAAYATLLLTDKYPPFSLR